MMRTFILVLFFTCTTEAQVYRTVESIVDGDTISLVGSPTRVRLLGIDAPENSNRCREAYGLAAKTYLTGLLTGNRVRLGYERGRRRDEFGRTLAYLWREQDGLFINRVLVKEGLARYVPRYPVRYAKEFKVAEIDARLNRRGLWKEEEK